MSRGVKITAVHPETKLPPLYYVTSPDILLFLIERGADINHYVVDGNPPRKTYLIESIINGGISKGVHKGCNGGDNQFGQAMILLQKNAKIETQGFCITSPLIFYCPLGIELYKELVARKIIDLNKELGLRHEGRFISALTFSIGHNPALRAIPELFLYVLNNPTLDKSAILDTYNVHRPNSSHHLSTITTYLLNEGKSVLFMNYLIKNEIYVDTFSAQGDYEYLLRHSPNVMELIKLADKIVNMSKANDYYHTAKEEESRQDNKWFFKNYDKAIEDYSKAVKLCNHTEAKRALERVKAKKS